VAELPSGIVTFLFTDIEGSTRLLRELGPERYADTLAEHRRVLREAFAAGAEVDTQGDAFFYAFADPRTAVEAARAGRDALTTVKVRMGLHTGTPLLRDDHYVGDDVHLGARVAAAGHGGQIVLTRATRDLLDGEVLRDLGEHRVKDFDEPLWVYQLGDEPFPPLKTISNTNLPRPASSFVGREREVREVADLVREARLVTLTGPGGSGKTRLSIEAASELVGEFRNGVFWVGLATIHDPAGVVPAIAQTLGFPIEDIGERELLLLLDNLEQVVECAPDVADLVERCPNLHVLATSRELLRVRGEVEYEVLPLADPDAVELFCLRAGIDPSPAVEELCRRLDNMPLALELAAARTKALTPEQILERLSRRLDLFQGGRDADERQRTLRGTIEWSYDLLSREEQRLFARLGVFTGGCTLDAAEEVAGADLDTIQSLVEKSLLRHTGERFWMLETIREYAAERLDAEPDAGPIRRHHAEHFLTLAESADLSSEDPGRERPEVVRPELDNIRAAIDWAADSDLELAFRLTIAMEQFWVMNDPFEGIRRLDVLLERGPHISPVLHARALRVLGETTFISGDYERGSHLAEAALAEFERLEDERAVAVMLHRLSTCAAVAQDFPRARRLLEDSLAICRRLPNPKLEADVVRTLGWVEQGSGNRERALELLEQGARLCGEIGYVWIQASALLSAADLLRELGRPEVAEERARDGLALSWQVVDRRLTVYAIAFLARLAVERGDVERAGRLWGAIEAEESRAPLGNWEHDRDEYAALIVTLGDVGFETGRTGGRVLSLSDAVNEALAGRKPAVPTSG
jgi:predicted ATPase